MDLWNKIQERFGEQIADFVASMPRYIFAIVVAILTYWLARRIQKFVKDTVERLNQAPEGAVILGRMAYFGVMVVGLLVALSVARVGLDLGTMVGTLGLSSVAIGFAFKDLLENFIAGVYLLVSRPFKIGDVIEIGGMRGTVLEIGTRAALIQKFDREAILMPCARLFKEEVTVVSRNMVRRITLGVGVDYESDLDKVRDVTMEALLSIESVLDDPAPVVTFDGFGESSIDLTMYFFSDLGMNDLRVVKNDVLIAVQKAYAEHGISIPFPHQVQVADKVLTAALVDGGKSRSDGSSESDD